jgi:hypothetical protein
MARFADSIVSTLNCVDRCLFKGYLPFGGDEQLNQFVDRLGIRRKDFLPQLEPLSERLVQHAKLAAAKAEAPYHYLQGQHSKEKLIDQAIRERKLTSGLVAVLCCLESCRTVNAAMPVSIRPVEKTYSSSAPCSAENTNCEAFAMPISAACCTTTTAIRFIVAASKPRSDDASSACTSAD